MRHQAVVPKQPLDRQRTDHRRDDEGQKRGRYEKPAKAACGTVDPQRQQQTTDENKRRRDHHIKQRELEGLQKFIVLDACCVRRVVTDQPQ